MPRPFLILFLLLCSGQSIAQALTGKVIDNSSKLPLHYAHIACPETGEGTITDESGNFKLILKDIRKSKTLIASFVGYQTSKSVIAGSENFLDFELSPDTTVLKGIEITANSGHQRNTPSNIMAELILVSNP